MSSHVTPDDAPHLGLVGEPGLDAGVVLCVHLHQGVVGHGGLQAVAGVTRVSVRASGHHRMSAVLTMG